MLRVTSSVIGRKVEQTVALLAARVCVWWGGGGVWNLTDSDTTDFSYLGICEALQCLHNATFLFMELQWNSNSNTLHQKRIILRIYIIPKEIMQGTCPYWDILRPFAIFIPVTYLWNLPINHFPCLVLKSRYCSLECRNLAENHALVA